MKILLTAASGPSGICFAKSLRELDDVRLIGTSAENDESSHIFFDSYHIVPFANAPDYLDVLKNIIDTEKIDFIIPFVDEELFFLTKNVKKLGCKVLASPYETIRYTGNKHKAYEILSDYLPPRYKKKDIKQFPVFAKPHVGRGGKGTAVIHDAQELSLYSSTSHVFQEVLSTPEVSVDTLFDFEGRMIVAVPRVRSAINQGISVRGEVFSDPTLITIIEDIAKRLVFVGPINFQFMRGKNGFVLTEINARAGGGMGISINAGADIPKLAYELMKHGKVTHKPTFHEGVYSNFEEVLERQRRKKQQEEQKKERLWNFL
jgi:carbamoyl-phosphate synthase large subunit